MTAPPKAGPKLTEEQLARWEKNCDYNDQCKFWHTQVPIADLRPLLAMARRVLALEKLVEEAYREGFDSGQSAQAEYDCTRLWSKSDTKNKLETLQ